MNQNINAKLIIGDMLPLKHLLTPMRTLAPSKQFDVCKKKKAKLPVNFPGHHVLTCMTQKNENRVTNTQHMHQGSHNTCIQLNQKQTRPESIIKLAQTINSDTCNFWQKCNNAKLGVLIDPNKNN